MLEGGIMSDNPYLAPTADYVSAGDMPADGLLQIQDKKAFGATPIAFPCICVKCGSTEEGGKTIDKKLAWCSPWALLLALISLIVLLVVYLIIRKLVRITYYLCPSCWGRLKTRLYINACLWISFVLLVISALALESETLGLICIPLFFIAILFGGLFARYPIRVTGYTKPIFQLKGFTDDFVRAYENPSDR